MTFTLWPYHCRVTRSLPMDRRLGNVPVCSRRAGTRRDCCSSRRGADAQMVTDREEASLCWDPAQLQRRATRGLGCSGLLTSWAPALLWASLFSLRREPGE